MARQTCTECRSNNVKKMVVAEENVMIVESSGESLQKKQKNSEKALNSGY